MKYISFIAIIQYIVQFLYANNYSMRIPITIHNNHFDIEVKAQLGVNLLDKAFKVDLKSSHSIIFKSSSYNKEVCPSLNIISRSKSIEIKKNDIVFGSYAIDILQMRKIFDNLQFIFLYVSDIDYAKETINLYSAYLSFARANTSFLSQLVSNTIINKRIVHFTNDDILIGDYNKTIVSSSRINGKCSAIKNDNNWACNITKISIGWNINENNPQIETNYALVFDSYAEEIIAPYQMVKFFREHYFDDQLFHKSCSFSEDYIEIRIVCDQHYMRRLRPLIFHLDNIALVFHEDYLIESNKTNMPRLDFRILFTKDQTYWSFDNRILIKYNIAFNEEENSISFFGNKVIDDDLIVLHPFTSFSSSKMNSYILISLTFVTISGILLLFVIKNKLIKN